ncbi:glycosyltransferase family 2 protein [Enterobacter roggenkampii]|uniref:glycosyltransferase family 2 protein n=1 Tax=Enterobacter roggenkampii TaxID=1812935 RepID=UPI001C70A20B|nr:glycosyltransferase family 2 protein [Enterobacter roggenkampii]MBW9393707.1 glycosyltransferase family 2 protein [Enterobacter roggenkampii]
MNILVSVIIPTFGRPVNLSRAIDSVLSQTLNCFEIIVVDDNDPESLERNLTEQVMSRYVDKNIKYVKHTKNENGAVARNTGFKHSRGNYISFLDDDDEFFSSKLENQIRFMVNNNYKFTYCRTLKCSNGKMIYESSYRSCGDLTKDILCSFSDLNSSSIIVERGLFHLVNGFDPNFRRNQDYEFILRCLEFEGLYCCDSVEVRRHLDSKINHPSFQQYISIRAEFFNKFKKTINKMSVVDYIDVISLYNIDLVKYSFRESKFMFIKYLFPILPTPYVVKVLFFKTFAKYVN